MGVAQATKDKTHQQKLERLDAEVKALRGQLRRAQRLATVGTMTAMVAHEFNNILTPIVNYAKLARGDPSLLQKAVDRAASGAERAAEICNAILGMTQEAQSEPVKVSLAETVAESIAATARDPRKDGIELVVDVPKRLAVTARPVELQQVLVNLLMNAREAFDNSGGPKRIELSARRSDAHVLIRLSDTGVGIPRENLAMIFEPFFTTNGPSNGSRPGSGLGLPISKDIVEGMGGRISVQSTPGRGSTFTIRLPA
ncbi:MAG: sensor histidine kinase [Planctomycetota bacterium]